MSYQLYISMQVFITSKQESFARELVLISSLPWILRFLSEHWRCEQMMVGISVEVKV